MKSPYALLFDLALSRLDAETAHKLTFRILSGLETARLPRVLGAKACVSGLACQRFGQTFRNPFGIAAGLDKDADAPLMLAALGFSHVEVGTVTLAPQPGNPKPRVWRFAKERAMVNAMGFPSLGADVVEQRLSAVRSVADAQGVRIGVNLGKNKEVPLEQAAEQYAILSKRFADLADYLVINVSSPNTPGLRDLQRAEWLVPLIAAALEARDRSERKPPLLVKLAPDLDDQQLEAIATAAADAGVDGIIATNTTRSRKGLPSAAADLPGGASGAPFALRSRRVIARVFQAVGSRIPIVGVGGVADVESAWQHILAGASLVQVYTGFIYGGPQFAARLTRGVRDRLTASGLTLDQAVGRDASKWAAMNVLD